MGDISTSKSDAELTAAKIDLRKIKEKLDDVEVKASDINVVQQFLNSLTDSVAELSARIEKIEIAVAAAAKQQQESAQDSVSSEAVSDLYDRLEGLTNSLGKEIDENSRRVDLLAEIMDKKADHALLKDTESTLQKSVDIAGRRIDGILENQWE